MEEKQKQSLNKKKKKSPAANPLCVFLVSLGLGFFW